MTKKLSLLGSTGSIGTQSLDVAEHAGFEVVCLAAHSNAKLLESQARKFRPAVVALVDETAAKDLKVRLADTDIRVLSGMDGVCECAAFEDADTVLNSVVGMAGLAPTLAAIEAKKTIALAKNAGGRRRAGDAPCKGKRRFYSSRRQRTFRDLSVPAGHARRK